MSHPRISPPAIFTKAKVAKGGGGGGGAYLLSYTIMVFIECTHVTFSKY